MFCLHCGTPFDEGDAFCEGCGKKIEAPKYTTCVHCGQLSEDADAFCEFCGKKIGGTDLRQPQAGSAFTSYNTPVAVNVAHTPPPFPTTPVVRKPAQVPPIHPIAKPRMLLVLLLDNSVSATFYINQLWVNISRFIIDINSDITTQNALDMALIQFNDNFSVLQDLPDMTSANMLQSITQGSACYSEPIREALRITDEYARTHTLAYKPWVIMIASGEPTDDITAVAGEIQNKQHSEKLRFMALGIDGKNSDSLKKLTDVVFRQKGADFTSFFEWVSKCIKVIVRTTLNDKPQLPQLEGNVYRDK